MRRIKNAHDFLKIVLSLTDRSRRWRARSTGTRSTSRRIGGAAWFWRLCSIIVIGRRARCWGSHKVYAVEGASNVSLL